MNRSNRYVTSSTLAKVAEKMLPFYRAIATRESFARQWSRAVVKADLDGMLKLLCSVAPVSAKQPLGTNGIGYFVDFVFPKPVWQYSSGTTIPPGTVQFTFETRIHRAVARDIFPLYKELAANRPFASVLARAIRRGDRTSVVRMVRSLVCTSALKDIRIEQSGIAMTFKYMSSKQTYMHLLFQGA